MKVIILAGGFGTRLGSIAEVIPKPLITIGNKPVVWHVMKTYSQYGFNDFILSLGYKQEQVKNFFATYDAHQADYVINLGTMKKKGLRGHNEADWNVALVDTGLNTLKGARLKRLEKYLDDDVNLLTYSDALSDVPIDKLVKFHKSHGKMLTITGVRPPSRFGEIIEKDSRVMSFKEKPIYSNELISGGYFVFNKKLLSYLTPKESCDLEYGLFEKLAKMGQVMVYKHLGDWKCVDNERELIQLNELWNSGKAFWKTWD